MLLGICNVFVIGSAANAIFYLCVYLVVLLAMTFWLVGFMKISGALLSVPIVCLLTCSERGQEH